MTEFNETPKLFAECLLQMAESEGKTLLNRLKVKSNDLRPLEDVVIPALEHIGQIWEQGEISLSQVYMAGKICERLVDEVLPSSHTTQYARPKIGICVLEDFHSLGKRMVTSMLRSSGFGLLDLGHGLKAADLVETVQRERIDILLISCLMLASAMRVRDVVDGLEKAGSKTAVVVGGAPFRLAPQLWKEVGAHYMGDNSGDAVKIVKTLMENRVWE